LPQEYRRNKADEWLGNYWLYRRVFFLTAVVAAQDGSFHLNALSLFSGGEQKEAN